MAKPLLIPKGCYVYFLCDPRDNNVFYVGKGKGCRMYNHVRLSKTYPDRNCQKTAKIQDIISHGHRVKYFVLKDGLSEFDALQLEASAMRSIGIENLTNYSNRIPQAEKQVIWATNFLRRIVPFERWYHGRTDAQKMMYWELLSEVKKIKEGYYADCRTQIV